MGYKPSITRAIRLRYTDGPNYKPTEAWLEEQWTSNQINWVRYSGFTQYITKRFKVEGRLVSTILCLPRPRIPSSADKKLLTILRNIDLTMRCEIKNVGAVSHRESPEFA